MTKGKFCKVDKIKKKKNIKTSIVQMAKYNLPIFL